MQPAPLGAACVEHCFLLSFRSEAISEPQSGRALCPPLCRPGPSRPGRFSPGYGNGSEIVREGACSSLWSPERNNQRFYINTCIFKYPIFFLNGFAFFVVIHTILG